MTTQEIEAKVKEIVMTQLNVTAEQVTPEASFLDDLGADSLDVVEITMTLEEAFGVEVPDDDADKLRTVGAVVKYIEERQAAA